MTRNHKAWVLALVLLLGNLTHLASLEISPKRKGDVVLVELRGELDMYHAKDLRQFCSKLFERPYTKIILSFQRVTYIDSSGLGAMITIDKEAKKRKVALYFVKIDGAVKKTIELAKLDDHLPIVADEEEAMKLLQSSTGQDVPSLAPQDPAPTSP